jgi:hypothetical protein
MHHWQKAVTGMAIGVLVGACQPGTPPAVAGARLSTSGATVRVTNQHWATVSVYLIHGGARFRLGTLSSMAVEEFRVPPGLATIGDLRLLVDPIGSRDVYVTDYTFRVSPGEVASFNIANYLPLSSISVHTNGW